MAKFSTQVMLVVLVGFLAAGVFADLPIHCIHSEVLGIWRFDLGSDRFDNTVTCGYELPDDNVQHFTKYAYKLQVERSFEIQLSQPNVATLVGYSGHVGATGTWTMVYDEGFEVQINGQTFFAFFGYEPKKASLLKSTKTTDYISHCAHTMVGWYHSANNARWGCYRAQKRGEDPWHPPQFNHEGKQQLEADAVVAPVGMLEVDSETDEVKELKKRFFVPDMGLIDHINNHQIDNLWEATVPKSLLGKSEHQLRMMSGATTYGKGELLFDAPHRLQHNDGSRPDGVLRGYTRGTGSHWWTDDDAKLERKYNLPSKVDWRNYRGVNYAGEVRSQGRCGSCYAFAMAYSAESRLKIATGGKEDHLFSPQQMLSCSVTNQGCNGGYPYLLAKHGHEIGFMPESCFPYVKKAQCSAGCPDSDMYYAKSDYGYIGGFYGASDEIGMMKELADYGPFVVALKVPRPLFYYRRGIFMSHDELEREPHWIKTNHAVTVVGYGTDHSRFAKPVKYWIVKNTWGRRWGDGGYFRIVRGSNNCGIECMPVVFHFDRKVSRRTRAVTPIFLEVRDRLTVLQKTFQRASVSKQANSASLLEVQANKKSVVEANLGHALHQALEEQSALEHRLQGLALTAQKLFGTQRNDAASLLEVDAAHTEAIQANLEADIAAAQHKQAEMEMKVASLNALAQEVLSASSQELVGTDLSTQDSTDLSESCVCEGKECGCASAN